MSTVCSKDVILSVTHCTFFRVLQQYHLATQTALMMNIIHTFWSLRYSFAAHRLAFMFHPRIKRRLRERWRKRRLQLLLLVGCLLCLLTVVEQRSLRGRFFGAKNIARTRKEVASIWDQLGCYQQRAYRMDTDQFHELHSQLLPQLQEHFPMKRS